MSKLPNFCRRILFSIVLFLSGIQGEARVYNFLRFTTSEGLAGDNVYFVTQDKDGFIWIATETGVSRFDGSSFKNYTVRDGLPSNDVNWLFTDSKNRVWMSPFKKEICYFHQGRIHNKYSDSWLQKIIITSEEKAIAEDKAGNLLFHTPEAVTYVTANDHCQTYAPSGYAGKGFFKPERLIGYIPMTFLDTSFRKYGTTYNGKKNVYAVNSVIDDETRTALEIIEGKRALIIFRKNGLPEAVKQSANIISTGTLTSSAILLNTTSGGYRYNLLTKRITDTLLAGMEVNVSYTDSDSGVWLGTNGSGLFYFPPNRSISIRQPVTHMPVYAYHLYSYKKEIWVGTNNWQLWKLDQRNQVLKPATEIDPHILYPEEGNLLQKVHRSILKVLSEQSGTINLNRGFKSLMKIQDTIIGVSPSRIVRYIFPNKILDSIDIDERLTCAFYHKGIYYAGTLDGFYILPKVSGSWSLRNFKPLIKGKINSIAYSNRNGLFWVLTSEDGVYCLRGSDHHIVKHFNEQNGLSSPVCTSIFTDGSKVYVGTINGLNIIDPAKDFSITCYYSSDGLPSNNVNCIYASDDKVWVGTTGGLSCIDITLSRYRPMFKLNFTQLMVSGKEIAPDTGNISLKPKDNNIRIEYSGVTFASMGKVQYHYRLGGLDDTWKTTDQRYLQYPSLPSGTYTFELYATDRFNTRSNRVHFAFTISKKWWEHGWIQILGLLLLLGLAGSALWWRFIRVQKREKEKIELKEKIMELEQLALRAQMNPHFIFNSLNSFYQYVINKDLEGASKFMSDFSHLIRLLFETTSQYEISLDKEIEFLSTYLALEQTKHSNSFSFDIFVQPDILIEEIVIPSFIIQPFIENGIWHGIQNRRDTHGKLFLSMTTDTDFLIISIEDNGVGRAYTDMLSKRTMSIHNSRGIALTEERIALYNKTHHSAVGFEITDKYENNLATGTQVIIKLPLKNIT